MDIGIIGLPQVGKKSLFRLLTQSTANGSSPEKLKKDHNLGMSKVLDQRVDDLAHLYNPKRVVYTTIKYISVPKLSKSSDDNREALKAISTVDALCHVVRAFDDETIFHIDGDINPERDIEFVESELLLNDLMFVENRIQKLQKDMKRKNDITLKQELALMEKLLSVLNDEKPLRLISFSEDEKKVLNAYPLLTRKNMFIALNVDEGTIGATEVLDTLQEKFVDKGMHFVQASCKIEAELAEIEDESERNEFLNDLGITVSALEKITQLSYRSLNLISFFTVGEDEVRAWTVRDGSLAPVAGGAIHSDIERGFIRAEHMRVEDLLALKSEQAVKDQGKFSLKGKDYSVKDGDILHFRFNV